MLEIFLYTCFIITVVVIWTMMSIVNKVKSIGISLYHASKTLTDIYDDIEAIEKQLNELRYKLEKR